MDSSRKIHFYKIYRSFCLIYVPFGLFNESLFNSFVLPADA
ncbi:hypothetical protein EMIT0215P_260021 [Pseudomonas serboccidentalis]